MRAHLASRQGSKRPRRLRARVAALPLALAAWALLAAGCAGLIQGDPSKLALPAAQAPSGFHALSGAVYANADVAQAFGIPESQVSGGMGRLTGYRATYVRDTTAASLNQGAIRVDSVVSLYQGAVPAQNALTFEVNANKQKITNLQTLSLGSLGQTSVTFAYTQTDTTTGMILRFVNVYWRERNALAAISVAGVQGAFPDSEAMQLARDQDDLLRKAP